MLLAAIVAVVGGIAALLTPQPRLRSWPVPYWQARSPWLLGIVTIELAAVFLGSPTVGLAGPVGAIMIRAAMGRLNRRAFKHRLQRALPRFTDDLAQQLRSGSSLSAGLVRVASDTPEVGAALSPALRALAAGDRLGVALKRVETSDEAFRLVLVTIGILVETGGPAADTIERMGENVRSVVASQEEAKALSGQGTASAVVLAVLPILFALLAGLSSQDLADFYIFQWAGAACITCSVLLTGASWIWMDALMWGRS